MRYLSAIALSAFALLSCSISPNAQLCCLGALIAFVVSFGKRPRCKHGPNYNYSNGQNGRHLDVRARAGHCWTHVCERLW
jgi:hypothetical protein